MKIENFYGVKKTLQISWINTVPLISNSRAYKEYLSGLILQLELNCELHSDSRQILKSNVFYCVHLTVICVVKKMLMCFTKLFDIYIFFACYISIFQS